MMVLHGFASRSPTSKLLRQTTLRIMEKRTNKSNNLNIHFFLSGGLQYTFGANAADTNVGGIVGTTLAEASAA